MSTTRPLLFTVEEAATMLGIKRTTLYQLLNSGELESVKIGRSRKIPADAVETYVARLREEQVSAVRTAS